jgi:RNA-directed DNA polymerase
MKQIRQRVKEPSPRRRCHADLRDVIGDLKPVLRGWGNYCRTGNAASRFNQLDTYVWRRPCDLLRKRKGRHLRAGEWERWNRDFFHNLGLHRLRGTVRYPEIVQCRDTERPPARRVREIRTHGLNGGPTGIHSKGEGR